MDSVDAQSRWRGERYQFYSAYIVCNSVTFACAGYENEVSKIWGV